MANEEIKKRRTTEVVDFDEFGRTVKLVRVEFMVGNDGPFTIEIPKEQFSKQRAQADMEKFAREVREL